jgi:hypothetical protein
LDVLLLKRKKAMNDVNAAGQSGTKSATPERKRRTIEQELMKRNKPILLAALAQLGIAKVCAAYSGNSDEGGFESAAIETAEGADEQAVGAAFETAEVEIWWAAASAWNSDCKGRALHRRNCTLAELIDDLAERLVDTHFGGYENEGGAQGRVVFQVDPAEIRIDHEWNVMRTEQDVVTL